MSLLTNEEAKQKIDELVEIKMSEFNAWEVDFISDMIDVEEFSDNQKEKIQEIWNEYCDNKDANDELSSERFQDIGDLK